MGRYVDMELVREVATADVVAAILGWEAVQVTPECARGECPIQDHARRGAHRLFCVFPGEGWYCHGCGRGGNGVELYAAVKGVTVYRAYFELEPLVLRF